MSVCLILILKQIRIFMFLIKTSFSKIFLTIVHQVQFLWMISHMKHQHIMILNMQMMVKLQVIINFTHHTDILRLE